MVVLPGFTSSTDDKNVAFKFIEEFSDKNILLFIDNSPPSLWRPKDIQKRSRIPEENEYLYPSVAKVLSKPVKKTVMQGTSYYEIRLQLDGQKFK